jgi:hypothetical protein
MADESTLVPSSRTRRDIRVEAELIDAIRKTPALIQKMADKLPRDSKSVQKYIKQKALLKKPGDLWTHVKLLWNSLTPLERHLLIVAGFAFADFMPYSSANLPRYALVNGVETGYQFLLNRQANETLAGVISMATTAGFTVGATILGMPVASAVASKVGDVAGSLLGSREQERLVMSLAPHARDIAKSGMVQKMVASGGWVISALCYLAAKDAAYQFFTVGPYNLVLDFGASQDTWKPTGSALVVTRPRDFTHGDTSAIDPLAVELKELANTTDRPVISKSPYQRIRGVLNVDETLTVVAQDFNETELNRIRDSFNETYVGEVVNRHIGSILQRERITSVFAHSSHIDLGDTSQAKTNLRYVRAPEMLRALVEGGRGTERTWTSSEIKPSLDFRTTPDADRQDVKPLTEADVVKVYPRVKRFFVIDDDQLRKENSNIRDVVFQTNEDPSNYGVGEFDATKVVRFLDGPDLENRCFKPGTIKLGDTEFVVDGSGRVDINRTNDLGREFIAAQTEIRRGRAPPGELTPFGRMTAEYPGFTWRSVAAGVGIYGLVRAGFNWYRYSYIPPEERCTVYVRKNDDGTYETTEITCNPEMADVYNNAFSQYDVNEAPPRQNEFSVKAAVFRMCDKISTAAVGGGTLERGTRRTTAKTIVRGLLDMNVHNGDVNLIKGSDECIFRQLIALGTRNPQLGTLAFDLTTDPPSDGPGLKPCVFEGQDFCRDDGLPPDVDPSNVGKGLDGVSRWCARGGVWYPFPDGMSGDHGEVFYCHTRRLMLYVKKELDVDLGRRSTPATTEKLIQKKILRIVLGEDRLSQIREGASQEPILSIINKAGQIAENLADMPSEEDAEKYWRELIIEQEFLRDVCATVATEGKA